MTSPIDEWPQPGDEILIGQPYSGSRPGGSLKRGRVERLTARDVVLADGTRFRRDKVDAGKVVIRRGGSWDPSTWGYHPEHAAARRMFEANELVKATGQLRNACGLLDQLAARDYTGGDVTGEALAAVEHAWRLLMATRTRYGLPVPVAASADAGQVQHGEQDEHEQHRVDGDAEHDGDSDDQDGDQQVD